MHHFVPVQVKKFFAIVHIEFGKLDDFPAQPPKITLESVYRTAVTGSRTTVSYTK
eukprot:m.665813 g.665813  ORF g.665813 m.665813 type:complete len:55 (-) comp22748_c0_seq19:642-806(-)